ncbi:MAG: methionine--tRNA ligase [Candidatus Cloacimonadaceae bacterium]|jgi:methionyl-tRNA synthetase|nr:methionine--tRNA ligase [Candidatus Cloacimonadota bacterium]MDD4559919.1 methionine--tRNA ligase [Candidatus Cloacimonadota bacterium]
MKYIVTSALPYANGKLHVGHVAGAYLPADIFVRYLRLQKEDVIYICGTDEHGTPISISADKEGVPAIDVVKRYHESIKEAFDGIGIEFDNFSGTAREEHYQLSQEFFSDLYKKGHIQPKTTLQFYCEHDKRYLPDRYVEGICPVCGAEAARGDQCDKCGQTYETTSLKSPHCKICGNKPIIRETKHWFFHLAHFTDQLKEWISHKSYWKENVRNFMLNLLEQGLIERSITRDLSWGVPVPLPEAEGKVLYVWFDAPIGYISSTVEWAKRIGQPERWKDYWLDKDTQLIHFIGKDNIIFHALIWPAMLMGQDLQYCLPHDIPANEFMNLEGDKISTSRNWAIWVDEFVHDFNGEYLRYYLATNAPERQDTDFSFKDFQMKINGELNNVLGNLANRVFAFAQKHFEGIISPIEGDEECSAIISEADRNLADISASYRDYQVKRNTRAIMDIARMGNRFFDERKPWVAIKEDHKHVQQTLWVCAELLHKISIALSPILPKHMLKLREMMSLPPIQNWEDAFVCSQITLRDVSPLFIKIEDAAIEAALAKLHKSTIVSPKTEYLPVKPEITYDQFSAMDLRLAIVLEASPVPKTDKLLRLKVDLGFETRELVAGIAESYKAEDILGKTVVMLVNLQARKIRGIVSNGMILAAHDESGLHVVLPDGGYPGSPVQ